MSAQENDRTLGMPRQITRRDILSGTVAAVTVASLESGASVAASTSQVGAPDTTPLPEYYPPKLTGLRGQYPGSFEVAHSIRDGTFRPNVAPENTGEEYDLIVVGGGISSGLSAGFFFRQMMGNNVRVLILDNHDDFGGHAKRNEFHYNGRMILGYGGTQSIETPYPYSYTARSLIANLGINVASRREHDRSEVYQGLQRAVFFDREHFGADKLVAGLGAKPWSDFFKEAPLSARARGDLVRLHTEKTDYMPDLDPVAKAALLKKISYQQFLTDYAKLSKEALPYFAGNGLRNNKRMDTCPAYEAAMAHAVGFAGMTIDREPEWHTDYEFHFPDGNATVARLLVNRMVPRAWSGEFDMDGIATAMIDYSKLDLRDNPVRIRLSSMAVHVEHVGDAKTARAVDVTYAKDGKLYRARGGNVVLACFNNIIPYITPGLPKDQQAALAYPSKVPMQYTNVLLRNWTAFRKLGIQSVSAPNGYHTAFRLDFPVAMKGYQFASSPDDPIVVHMSRNPNSPGLPRKEQNRLGRADMLSTPFEKIEREIRSQLGRTLHSGGFDPAQDIVAITVNRWPHGYAYTYDSLNDPEFAQHERPHVIGHRLFGRIAIANSDAGAAAFTNEAIDQAQRAIHDCLYSRGLL